MSPDQLAQVTALFGLLERMGGWPMATVLIFVLFGPWMFAFFLHQGQERRFQAQEQRHQAVVRMYENNVALVQAYEAAAKRMCQLEADTRDIMIRNTEALTRLTAVLQSRVDERITDGPRTRPTVG